DEPGLPLDVTRVRRVQLAGQLARLFDDYRFTRPELIDAWTAGRQVLQQVTGAASLEQWQQPLWRTVVERLDASPRKWVRLEHLFDSGLDLSAALPETLYLFGMSWISPAERNLIAWLATHARVHLFVLNPCMEFWEDV